ncbi:MAG: hypothetical protein ACOYL6_03965 [Bacteriovoracaceae bacterium]
MNLCEKKKGPNGPFFINLTILLLGLVLSSCSYIQQVAFKKDPREKPDLSKYEYMSNRDYLEHLDYLGDIYIKSPDVNTFQLSKEAQNYTLSVLEQILVSNETIFKKKFVPKISVVQSLTPFHFSTPNGHIYLSTGLLKKYINNENLLAVVLAIELLRSDKNVYIKNSIIPVGYISTERFLALVRMPFEEKLEMNKWTYYVLRRAGYDSENVLNLIQIKNKNTLDFSLQLGDTKMIAREESLFKAFIVKKYVDSIEKKKTNSSKGFYLLSRDLQRVVL